MLLIVIINTLTTPCQTRSFSNMFQLKKWFWPLTLSQQTKLVVPVVFHPKYWTLSYSEKTEKTDSCFFIFL